MCCLFCLCPPFDGCFWGLFSVLALVFLLPCSYTQLQAKAICKDTAMARTTTTSGGPHRALKCCVMPLSLPPATPLCCPSPPPLIVWQCLQVQISKWIAFLSLGKVLQHAGNLSSCCFSHPTHLAQGYFPGKLVPANGGGENLKKSRAKRICLWLLPGRDSLSYNLSY